MICRNSEKKKKNVSKGRNSVLPTYAFGGSGDVPWSELGQRSAHTPSTAFRRKDVVNKCLEFEVGV